MRASGIHTSMFKSMNKSVWTTKSNIFLISYKTALYRVHFSTIIVYSVTFLGLFLIKRQTILYTSDKSTKY